VQKNMAIELREKNPKSPENSILVGEQKKLEERIP